MKTISKLIVGVAIAAASASSFAWGEREQGALAGLIIGALIANQNVQVAPPVVVQPPVVVIPNRGYQMPHRHYHYRQPVCYFQPEYDYYGNIRQRMICR